MIILTTNDSITAVLSENVTTEQPNFYCSWIGTDDVPGNTKGLLNGTTEVTIISSPTVGQKLMRVGFIYNSDTKPIEVTLQVVNGLNKRIIAKEWVASKKTLTFGRKGITQKVNDTTGIFEVDQNGDLMPSISTGNDEILFELDESGNVMPITEIDPNQVVIAGVGDDMSFFNALAF